MYKNNLIDNIKYMHDLKSFLNMQFAIRLTGIYNSVIIKNVAPCSFWGENVLFIEKP